MNHDFQDEESCTELGLVSIMKFFSESNKAYKDIKDKHSNSKMDGSEILGLSGDLLYFAKEIKDTKVAPCAEKFKEALSQALYSDSMALTAMISYQ